MGRDGYRKGVVVVLKRPGDSKVLLCHRAGASPDEGWQFPQGGVEKGCELLAEAKRELREEIGCDAVLPVATTRKAYCYEIPPEKRRTGSNIVGQCHRWVLAEFLGSDKAVSFRHQPAEFDAFEWVEPSVAFGRVVSFKKRAYSQALSDLGLIGPQDL